MKQVKIKDLTVRELLFDIMVPDEQSYVVEELERHYGKMIKKPLTKKEKAEFKKFLDVEVGVETEEDRKILREISRKK